MKSWVIYLLSYLAVQLLVVLYNISIEAVKLSYVILMVKLFFIVPSFTMFPLLPRLISLIFSPNTSFTEASIDVNYNFICGITL